MPVDLSRETFKVIEAPKQQKCSCGCNQTIIKGQQVYAHKYAKGNGPFNHGAARIIDLEDHYRAWLERVAHKYAASMAQNNRFFADYLGVRGRR